jgi:hypothetical protein
LPVRAPWPAGHVVGHGRAPGGTGGRTAKPNSSTAKATRPFWVPSIVAYATAACLLATWSVKTHQTLQRAAQEWGAAERSQPSPGCATLSLSRHFHIPNHDAHHGHVHLCHEMEHRCCVHLANTATPSGSSRRQHSLASITHARTKPSCMRTNCTKPVRKHVQSNTR